MNAHIWFKSSTALKPLHTKSMQNRKNCFPFLMLPQILPATYKKSWRHVGFLAASSCCKSMIVKFSKLHTTSVWASGEKTDHLETLTITILAAKMGEILFVFAHFMIIIFLFTKTQKVDTSVQFSALNKRSNTTFQWNTMISNINDELIC